MAIEVIKNINVDFIDKKYTLINAKQYDDRSRCILITCYNQGDIFNLSTNKHTAYVRYRKSDGYAVFNVCSIDYKGRVSVELTEQMLARSGVCYVDLIIVNKGSAVVNIDTGSITTIDDSQILSTMAFCVDVHESAVDNPLIESSYEYDGLNDLLIRAEAEYSEVAQLARSYAIGDANNAREGEDTDNSKYYSRMSRSYAIGDSDGIRKNEDTDNAKYYSEQSKNSADAADESEESAANSASSASNSATNASNSAIAAANSETNAAGSATSAHTSAQNAANSATAAANSESNALESKTSAANSAESAAASEASALQSKTSAATSAESAANSESNAANSESAAASSAEAASNSEASALQSETNASASASAASNSESNAAQSETNAAASASAASASEISAKTSETNANNYYTWIEQAVNSMGGVFLPMGTIAYSELAAIKESDTLRVGHLYNISDSFITDDTFKDGAGVEYAAGTSVYFTEDGYWDCLVGTMIAEVATVDEVTEYLGI